MSRIGQGSEKRYSMKAASIRTGLSPHAIRAWERRYGAVSPLRDSNNRRYYGEGEIERLTLLHKATEAGFQISQIAGHSREELRELVGGMNVIELPVRKEHQFPREAAPAADIEDYAGAFVMALERMDRKALELVFASAETELGRNALLELVVVPMMERVGDMWRKGELRISHEHMASQIVRTFLGGLLSSQQSFPGAPHAVVTTPSDQAHELGALTAAVTAASEGWNVSYMGPNLPAEEIAGTVKHNSSRAVILSLIYPESDPTVARELRKLRRYLPETAIIVGGRAKHSYSQVLGEIEAMVVGELYELRQALESLLR